MKSIKELQDVHFKQLLTYCKLTDKHLYEEIEAYLKQEKKGNVEEIENLYQLIGC